MASKEPSDLDIKNQVLIALQSMSDEDLRAIAQARGITSATAITPDLVASMAQAFAGVTQTAVKETLRQERKENPFYPEKSVFHPAGIYDDTGKPLPAKVKFRRPTFFGTHREHRRTGMIEFGGVRLQGELETEDEIILCNEFTVSRTARGGKWRAAVKHAGTDDEALEISIPSFTQDNRMENAVPFVLILRELLHGADAVTHESMAEQLVKLQARLAELEAKTAA